MASSPPDQNHPTNREEGQPPSEGGGGGSYHHQQNPYPAAVYPPVTGYPPAMGYPAYQHNYYPNYGTQQQVTKPRKLSGVFRGIIGGLIFFFLFFCIIRIITWLILHPATPIFHVNYLAVSDFNISSSPITFTANWAGNISARNPNEKLKIYFDEIDVYMIYKGEYLVASSTAEPFPMNTKENTTMMVKLSAAKKSPEDSEDLKRQELGKMETERNSTGKLRFEMRMMVWSTFRSGNWWARHVLIKVFCENLEIGFLNNNSSNGALANAHSLPDCLVTA